MTDRKPFDLMTPSKAARLLGVARNTVIHRIATQQYRAEKVGGVLFVVSEDVEKDVPRKDRAA